MVRWIFPNTHIPRSLTMPDTTLLDIPQAEQDQMLAALRRARYGYLLALHVLLLCAAGRHPTEMATFLFCSRSSIYRIVRLYRTQQLGFTVDAEGQLRAPVRTTILMPGLKRSLGALLKAPPRAYGWCRTRWSCATLAAQLQTKHGFAVSAGDATRRVRRRGRVGPYDEGCMRWTGCGNEPNWWRKITTHSGPRAWPGFGGMPSTCKRMRCWSLPMNSISKIGRASWRGR